MGVAVLADDLGAAHEEVVVGPQLDLLEVGRLGEAGPAGAAVELRVRGEQLRPAANAVVHPLALLVPVRARERPLGTGLARHLVLLRRQLLAPLGVRLLDLLHGERVEGGGGGSPDALRAECPARPPPPPIRSAAVDESFYTPDGEGSFLATELTRGP